MEVAKNWKDYEIIDMANGEKLERWGNVYLIRPDPQIIWKEKTFANKWKMANARYSRSSTGGGNWNYIKKVPANWQVKYKELTFKIKIMELKHFYIISTLLLIILFATIYFLHEQITASWTDTPSYTVEKQYEPVKLPTIHHEEDSGTSGFDYEDTGAHSDTITLRQNQDEGIFWRSIILSGQPDSVLIVFDSTFSKNPARVIHISNTLFLDFNRK